MVFDQNLAALQHEDTNVRLDAITRLTSARYVAAIPRLITMLDDPDARVRLAVTKALGEFKAVEAVPEISKMLSDPDSRVRAAARLALIVINTKEARTILAVAERMMGDNGDTRRLKLQSFDLEDTVVLRAAQGIVVPMSEIYPNQDVRSAAEARFSAYYPKETVPQQWCGLLAYVFKAFAAEEVIKDAQRMLGGQVTATREATTPSDQGIPDGTEITARPHLEGFQFNPPQITLGFYEDWHRFEFKMRANTAPVNQSVNGHIFFTVKGVIVSSVPISVFVSPYITTPNMTTVMQKLYKSIFCSYSREDTRIVERVEAAYEALGFEFLRDVQDLKSGENWNEGLLRLIDEADIFQLFWSNAAARSPFVEREWRHALNHLAGKSNFIRPVYWETPMPPVPPELSKIHFAYQPELDD